MSRDNRLFVLVLIPLLGCSMVPKLEKTELPTAPTWEEAPAALSDQGAAAAREIAWDDFFRSEAMREVVETTLENNRDLRIAILNVAAVRARYRITRSAQRPDLSAGLDAARQGAADAQLSAFGEGITYTQLTADLASTNYEIDLFGRVRSLSAAALERYFASEAAAEAARISLISEAANAYLRLLSDRATLALVEETLATQEKTLELIERRAASGVSSRLELSQAKSIVEAARADLARYKRLTMQDRNALVLLMGIERLPESLDRPDLDGDHLMDALPVGLPSEVLLLRPDVRQAEHELRAANADIGAARAALFPRIALTGSYGFASNSLSDLFSSSAAGAWRLAAGVTVPIFARGRLRAELEVAEVGKEIALATYEKALQTAFREVADELASGETLDGERRAQMARVEATRETYELSMARYEAGVDSFLQALDAQRALFAAQTRLIDIERQRSAHLVDLYRTLGGGVSGRP